MFELVDAIESGHTESILEELGDVLFHIAFIARMFEERGEFDLNCVARSITEKMIRRHPHVFGEEKVRNSAEVVQNWHRIKRNEQKNGKKQSCLDSVPAKLPALIRAYRISDRTAKSGFEWTDMSENPKDLRAFADRLAAILQLPGIRSGSRLFGDMLFDLVNLARLDGVHPESALAGSVKKFEAHFKLMEAQMDQRKQEFEALTPAEKQHLWNEATARTSEAD